MKLNKKDLILYAVTDRTWLGGRKLYDDVEKAIRGGATMIQLREKNLTHEEFKSEALEIQKLCKKYNVPFIINDDVELAVEINADGVHVGQSDMEAGNVRNLIGNEKILGVSVQTPEQAVLAEQKGADYLGAGAVFHTDSKSDAADVSHETLKKICESVKIPVVAIGGINAKNIHELSESKLAGVAVISAVFAAENIEKATSELKNLTEKIFYHASNIKTALTIAGSDSSGGAGIQADIKTMTMNGVYAMSAITALTAQNTTGVTGILESSPEFLKQQLDAVFCDIFPDSVKIGMVSSSELIKIIAERLKFYKAKKIVVDPVMVATSGAKLINDNAVETLEKELLPLALIITPNIPEAEILSGIKIQDEAGMINAAKIINEKYKCSVLLKGGHMINDASDFLYVGENNSRWFKGKRIETFNTHGTGCTLSSAIASNLAKGFSLENSVERAKEYISGALASGLNLGKGCGPMNHAFNLTGKFSQRQSLVEKLMSSVSDIWPEYNNHPFVKGIETGTLDKNKFKRYIIQDYLYLNEYSKVFAVGAAKSKNLETMKLFASVINAIANVEMDIHKGYMGQLGVSENDIANAKRELENLSYTSYMLRIAYEEGEAEILAAILSCALSYEDIAKKILKNNPNADKNNFYGDWIKCYSGQEYCALNKIFVEALEETAKDYSEEKLNHIAEIFRECSLYEMGFWDMGSRNEKTITN